MRILITYDVNTTTPAGERRLRRLARACLDYGQRVQQSVFECSLTQAQMEQLRERLLCEIDLSVDSLRVYRLPDAVDTMREVYGVTQETDFTGPLVL
jgi:CRISPR-associated protein Cas2